MAPRSKNYADLLAKAVEIVEEGESSMDISGDSDDDDDLNSTTSSQHSSPEEEPQPQRRKVQFHLVHQTRAIMSCDDYTEKERRKCWYSPAEKEKSEERRCKIMLRMEAGKKPSKSKGSSSMTMTYRGLLYLTEQGERDLERNISTCVDDVMDEQLRQWTTNEDDWDRLAAVSKRVTRESAKEALKTAKQDENDARLAWEEENDKSNIGSEDETSTTSKAIKKKKPLSSSKRNKSKSKKERERRATSRKSDHKDPSVRKDRSKNIKDEVFLKLSKQLHLSLIKKRCVSVHT
jgi:hypothetical protein